MSARGESVIFSEPRPVVSYRWLESRHICASFKVSGPRDYDYDTRDKNHLSAFPYATSRPICIINMMAFSTLLKYLKVKIIHCNVNDRAGDASEGEPVNHDTTII